MYGYSVEPDWQDYHNKNTKTKQRKIINPMQIEITVPNSDKVAKWHNRVDTALNLGHSVTTITSSV